LRSTAGNRRLLPASSPRRLHSSSSHAPESRPPPTPRYSRDPHAHRPGGRPPRPRTALAAAPCAQGPPRSPRPRTAPAAAPKDRPGRLLRPQFRSVVALVGWDEESISSATGASAGSSTRYGGAPLQIRSTAAPGSPFSLVSLPPLSPWCRARAAVSFPRSPGRRRRALLLFLRLPTRRRARGGALQARGKQLWATRWSDARREGNDCWEGNVFAVPTCSLFVSNESLRIQFALHCCRQSQEGD
jgi:hypothetical protein